MRRFKVTLSMNRDQESLKSIFLVKTFLNKKKGEGISVRVQLAEIIESELAEEIVV